MMELKEQINTQNLPRHIAIIMDGNGRWAQQQGKQRTFGHENGVEAVRSVVEGACELQIPYLTLYTFSTYNCSSIITIRRYGKCDGTRDRTKIGLIKILGGKELLCTSINGRGI